MNETSNSSQNLSPTKKKDFLSNSKNLASIVADSSYLKTQD